MAKMIHRVRRVRPTAALLVGSLSCALALVAGVAGYGCAKHTLATRPESSPPGAGSGPAVTNKAAALREDALGLGRIAALAMPAVVSVASTHVSETQTFGLPFDDPFFGISSGPTGLRRFRAPGGRARRAPSAAWAPACW